MWNNMKTRRRKKRCEEPGSNPSPKGHKLPILSTWATPVSMLLSLTKTINIKTQLSWSISTRPQSGTPDYVTGQ